MHAPDKTSVVVVVVVHFESQVVDLEVGAYCGEIGHGRKSKS